MLLNNFCCFLLLGVFNAFWFIFLRKKILISSGYLCVRVFADFIQDNKEIIIVLLNELGIIQARLLLECKCCQAIDGVAEWCYSSSC